MTRAVSSGGDEGAGGMGAARFRVWTLAGVSVFLALAAAWAFRSGASGIGWVCVAWIALLALAFAWGRRRPAPPRPRFDAALLAGLTLAAAAAAGFGAPEIALILAGSLVGVALWILAGPVRRARR